MEREYHKLSLSIKWATALIALLYAFFFIWRLVVSFIARSESGVDVDFAVTRNPQFLILLSLGVSAIALVLWRDVGRLIASGLLGVVLLKFALWASMTADIKVNAGLENIPQANWIGNQFIGAGWPEVVALIGAITLLIFNVLLIWRRRDDLIHALQGATITPSAPKYQ